MLSLEKKITIVGVYDKLFFLKVSLNILPIYPKVFLNILPKGFISRGVDENIYMYNNKKNIKNFNKNDK